jgi:hypothetical protein
MGQSKSRAEASAWRAKRSTRGRDVLAAALCLLASGLLASPAYADPGLSSLEILHYPFLFFVAVVGVGLLVIVPGLLRARRLDERTEGPTRGFRILIGLAIVFLVVASPFFFWIILAPRLVWWMYGPLILILWIASSTLLLFDVDRRSVRIAAAVVLGFVLVRTPEIFSYTRYEIVDNALGEMADPIELLEQKDSEYLPLADGRLFFLEERYNSSGPGPIFEPGTRLVIDKAHLGADDESFHLHGIGKSQALYQHELDRIDSLITIPLDTIRIDRNAVRTIGRVRLLGPNWRADDLTLHRAIYTHCCDPEWIRELIRRGADPNQITRYADTNPLHGLASQAPYEGEFPRTVTILVDAGVDLQASNNLGKSPLHVAVDATLHDAFRPEGILEAHRLFLRRLLELGADPNTHDLAGTTPLHETIPRFPELARMLIEYGADPTLESARGESAIDRALYYQTKQKAVLSDSQEEALDALIQEMRRIVQARNARTNRATATRDGPEPEPNDSTSSSVKSA